MLETEKEIVMRIVKSMLCCMVLTSITSSLLTAWALILVLASMAQADPKPGTPVAAAEPKLAFVAGAQPGELVRASDSSRGTPTAR